MTAANLRRTQQAAAEILHWQVRLRLGFLAVVAGAGALLRVLGAVRHASLVTLPAIEGVPGFLVGIGALAAGYAAVLLALRAYMRRVGAAGPIVLGITIAADLAVILGTLLLLVPPEYYARGLVAAFFTFQLTQSYFGRVAAGSMLIATAALYVGLLAAAGALGAAPSWPEELWTLVVFLVGGLGCVQIQGNSGRRLDRLVRMFEATEGGDFTQAYDETRDRFPDNITRVGRAYNRMRNELATVVLTDPLSGCLNRRGFEQALTRELARASRSGHEVALLAIDVDYFKRINDTFGHLAGDEVIRESGELLRATARAGDLVARVGGEEFVILVPDTGAAGAYHLASRLVEAFRRRAFAGVEGRIPVTVSVGVVADRATESAAYDLRARADEALYTAKRTGRNRVVVWTHGMQLGSLAMGARLGR